MDTCRACGARLSEDLDWCGRCLTPIHPVGVDAAATAGRSGAATPWMRQPGVQRRAEAPKAQFSRWKAGPTSFGAGGRIVPTMAILMGAVVGFPMAKGGIVMSVGMDVPTRPFMVMYAIIAAPVCLYLLARVWKRARVA